MTACALTAGLGAVDVFANVPPEAEIAAETPPAEPVVTESVPEILVPAGDTTDPVPDESMPDVVPEGDPLTPDGNMTLVDDVGSSTGRGKQFITMVTKNGNYFYVIIDRDDDGKENVHFLNQVDEEDLLRLMDEEEADAIRDELAQQKITPTPVPTKVVEKPAVTPEPVEKKKTNLVPILAPAVLLAGGGAGYAYYRYRRKKQAEAEKVDPDADYREDEFDFDDSYGEEDEDEPYDEA
jgi:hypothetical protein